MRCSKLATLALAVVLLVVASPAAHATVLELDGSTLVVKGEPGEANWPSVGSNGAGRLEVSDDSIASWPSTCDIPFEGADYLECDVPGALRFDLGDGNDRVNLPTFNGPFPAIPIAVLGGPGDDTLEVWDRGDGSPVGSSRDVDGGDGADTIIGSEGSDVLRGGPGNDKVFGAGGGDTVEGGDGNDTLSGDKGSDGLPPTSSPGADTVDGGAGFDTLDDYDRSNVIVEVTINGIAGDGEAGENDNLISLENVEAHAPGSYSLTEANDKIYVYDREGLTRVYGLGGNDDLEGDTGREEIDGGPGDDTLEGGYNDDVLTGGPGRDTINADEGDSSCGGYGQGCKTPFGNDVVYARDGEADSIDCGVGNDTAYVDAIDTVANCETVERQGGPGPNNPCTDPSAPGCSPTAAPCSTTPKVKKLKLRKARKLGKAAGCTVKVKKARSKKVKKGLVIKAKRKGTTLTLVVSKGR